MGGGVGTLDGGDVSQALPRDARFIAARCRPRVQDVAALLDLFIRHRAAGELENELQNRPDWAHIPLSALAAPTEG